MNKAGVFVAIGLLALSLGACSNDATSADQTDSEQPAATEQEQTEVTELNIKDTQTGEGAEAEAGMEVSVHYTGWLYDPDAADNKGTKFDSSLDRGQPFTFPLGAGMVIPGWDEGVAGMKVGGQRTLIIPPDMGYGAQGSGALIPPNATLIFDVELLDMQ